MQIEVVKSKIHRVSVTGADLDYVGSITLDDDLMEAAGIIPGERVYIVNVNNGERFDTYTISGEKGTGAVVLNGPAARKVQKGDIIIIIAYASLTLEEAKTFKPRIVFPNEVTNLIR
jgi:aspartate 1-decarboxylase